ncbi:MAG: NAD-dependent deacylase [Pseudomonadota bacterium]
MTETARNIEAIAARVKQASHVMVMTGSGISAESGIPTFREAQTGLWEKFRPEDLATPEAFERDPETVWKWYEWRRDLVGKAAPNPGHGALVTLAERVPLFSLITQNVDGLHQRAGSTGVVELHGSIIRTICSSTRRVIDRDWLDANPGSPPRSPYDPHGLARPGVVWFGEPLPADAIDAAALAVATCDLFFSIGTSGLVEPAASFGHAAADRGAHVVEINPAPTPLSPRATWLLREPAGDALPRIVEALDALG